MLRVYTLRSPGGRIRSQRSFPSRLSPSGSAASIHIVQNWHEEFRDRELAKTHEMNDIERFCGLLLANPVTTRNLRSLLLNLFQ